MTVAIDFNPIEEDTHAKYEPTTAEWKAPVAGWYTTASKVITCEFTGLFTYQQVTKKWWQFWVPDFKWAPEYVLKERFEGRQIAFLEKDQIVSVQIPPGLKEDEIKRIFGIERISN